VIDMAISSYASWMLAQEARALLFRLSRVKPFVMIESMVPAAALMPTAQALIERHLINGRRDLHGLVTHFLSWLQGPAVRVSTNEEAYRRFTFLRLKFNATLKQFDLFSTVITQRSEYENGVWISGLDVVAADALDIPGGYYDAPPVICYLDSSPGAAIRRARTRLPGGGDNPVAIIRVPRERMVGSGIASSLIHEVGHQGAALLDLVNSLRPILQSMQRGGGTPLVWQLWERWISEIVADFWSISCVGVGATMGLIGVVSLPRPFIFRMNFDDPHPSPWIRVKLSCAMGQAIYPHPQWAKIAALWESFYPMKGLPPAQQQLISLLQASMPGLVGLLINHRPKALRGRSLIEVMQVHRRQPIHLQRIFRAWNHSPAEMYRAPPSLVFCVIGQARASGELTPEEEGTLLSRLLNHWALRSTIDTTVLCGDVVHYKRFPMLKA
jgi:hypothetical protein